MKFQFFSTKTTPLNRLIEGGWMARLMCTIPTDLTCYVAVASVTFVPASTTFRALTSQQSLNREYVVVLLGVWILCNE
jgi:hypothetical protein